MTITYTLKDNSMELKNREVRKQYRVKSKPILSMVIGLTFISIILLVTMLETGGSKPAVKPIGIETEESSIAEEEVSVLSDTELLAVVKEINTQNELITLFDINHQEDVILTYHGGSNIVDKYEQPILAGQIPIGSLVEIGYQKDQNKLQRLQISDKAWEYEGVSNFMIDSTAKTMKIATTNYRYTDNTLILDGQNMIRITDLAEQDLLTVWGYEETIWSIIVTRGHGTVILEDYEPFLGAFITIGYESIQQITDDMEFTVREGRFDLTVENGKFSATKKIEVKRNQQNKISLSDLGPGAVKIGKVTFEITPFGADLFIDGVLTSYANPLELTYGTHSIEVSLGGYTTYRGSLEVDVAGKIIKIDLPETLSNKDVIITEEGDYSEGSRESENNSDEDDEWEDEDQNESEEEYIIDDEHSIFITNPIGASVYLNGEYKGSSPVSFEKVIGSHVITLIKEGYETKSHTIEVEDDGLDAYFSLSDLILMD